MPQPFLDEPGGREFAANIARAGHIDQSEDVAEVAVYLAGGESRFVTGAAYPADGGWTAGMTRAIVLVVVILSPRPTTARKSFPFERSTYGENPERRRIE